MMDAERDFLKARFIRDSDTGELLTVEKDREYSDALTAFYESECKHPETAEFRVTIANGDMQVRTCCVNCGHRLGTALPQKDKAKIATLPWQPIEHAETYKSRRASEWKATLLDLARRQHADRGRFTKSYAEYIKSGAWRAKRALVLTRCGNICEGCRVAKATEVHHATYYHLYDEFLFELLGLCHTCHERLTNERRAELTLVEKIECEEDIDDEPF